MTSKFKLERPVVTFLVSTFLISWVIGIIAVIVLQIVEQVIGLPEDSISNLVPKYGPTLGGLISCYVLFGKSEFLKLFKRGFKWKAKWYYWLFILCYPVAIVFMTMMIRGESIDLVSINGAVFWSSVLLFATPLFLGGGFGEEYGWRGFMLPELMKKHNALYASLIIGVFWFLWHVPAFLLGDKGKSEPIIPFFIFVMAAAVIMTWLYYRTDQSVLLLAIFHAAVNSSFEIVELLTGKVLPDSENEFYTYAFALAALTMSIFLVLTQGKDLGIQRPDLVIENQNQA